MNGYSPFMPRSIWTGAISFGLVNVPVKLFSATEDKDIHFNQFQKDTGERIRYKRVAEGTGEEVEYEDIVKGYEKSKGRFVIVTPEELESVEPGKSRTIEIEDFVDLDDLDPIYFEKTYYLAPQEGAGADKAYALLREAMEKANKVAIGRFVMRTKQYLTALRPSGDLLLLETMFFPDEIRSTKELQDMAKGAKVSDRELKVAEQLIDSLTTDWDPDRYHDTYRERVLDLIEQKAKGKEVVVEKAEAPESNVVDLLAALEASLSAAGKGTKKKPSAAKKATKKTSKSTTKKASSARKKKAS
jgi:DNA end-binding protein Ku